MYPSQVQVIRQCRKKLYALGKKYKSSIVLLQLPTASGKTKIICFNSSYWVKTLLQKRIIIAVPSEGLRNQMVIELDDKILGMYQERVD